MPGPKNVNGCAPVLMVKALAYGSKTAELTRTRAERNSAVVFELLNVAMSAASLGTVSGVQFAAVFQSLLVGSNFHVALLAWIYVWRGADMGMSALDMTILTLFRVYASESSKATPYSFYIIGCFINF